MNIATWSEDFLRAKGKEVWLFSRALLRMRPKEVVQVMHDKERARTLVVGCVALAVMANIVFTLLCTFAQEAMRKFEIQFAWFQVLLFLAEACPLYFVFRLFGLGKRFALLVSAQLVTGSIAAVVFGILLGGSLAISHGLDGELTRIHDGKGKDTLFYRAMCQPVADKINYVHDLFELQKMDEQQQEGLISPDVQRSSKLESDVRALVLKMQAGTDLSDSEASQFLSRYLAFLIALAAIPLVSIGLMIWRLTFVWKYLAREHKRLRIACAIITAYVAVGVVVYSVADLADMRRKAWLSLEDARADTHTQAKLLVPVCGEFDSAGLW